MCGIYTRLTHSTDRENPGQMPCGLLSVCKTVLTADQAQLGRRVQ